MTPLKGFQCQYTLGIVGIVKDSAPFARAACVIEERRVYLFHALEVIGMVHSHVEHNRQGGVEIKEGIHILASLKNKVLLFATNTASGVAKQRDLRTAKNGGIGGL